MWISLWTVKGRTVVNGLKTLKPPVDRQKRARGLSTSTPCLKPRLPTYREQALTPERRRETGLSTVSTRVINTTNPKKSKSLKQQSLFTHPAPQFLAVLSTGQHTGGWVNARTSG
jgi:hypothetical protein